MSSSRNQNAARVSPALLFVAIWAFLQLARVWSVATLQGITAGTVAVEWLYPAIIDLLIGLSAPLIAFFIWRKSGLWPRLITLLWLAVSCLEHVETIALNLISVKPHALWGTTPSTIALELALFALFDAIAFVILWQQMLGENLAPGTNGRAKSRVMVIVVVVWTVLQIPRYIAIPILQNIFSGGTDPAAWLLPAFGDIVIATLAPVVIYVVWRKQGLWVWALTLVWLFLSIYDHMSTVAASATTPPPQFFIQSFGAGTTPSLSNATMPIVQAVIDVLLFLYVAQEKVRLMFVEKQRALPK